MLNKYSILHVLLELQPHGAEQRTLELIQGSRHPQIQHHVLTLSGRSGPLVDKFVEAGCYVHVLNWRKPTFILRAVHLMRKKRIRAIHSSVDLLSGLLMLAAAVARVPVRITHMRTTQPMNLSKARKAASSTLLRTCITLMSTHLIGVTEGAARSAQIRALRRFGPTPQAAPSGADLAQYTNLRTDTLRDALNIPHDKKIVLHVGRDSEVKNRTKARAIAAAALRDKDDLVLILAGGNKQHSHANVYYLGHRSDIRQVIADSDLLLCTSFYEGLPGAVLEARLLGVPVLSSILEGSSWIDSELGGVKQLPLTAPDEEWLEVIRAILRDPNSRTHPLALKAAGGPFDLAVQSIKHRHRWTNGKL